MENENASKASQENGRVSFFGHLEALLRTNGDYVADDGRLLRNKVAEAAATLDPALLRLLLSDVETKKRFFTEVDGTLVFDKAAFGWTVENREFLPDSFTRFKNRIGLADSNGGFLSSSPDVVLSFPYKDCVLEGGQTKEDQKRREVFYNRILAPDEVDRLLEPKALCHAVRHDKDGTRSVTTFDPATDNLLIKGNNLLALASLLPRYEGKIQLIYIDPPYNTGNDGFEYNDSFNHSTWLVFMKNRLELAKRLLSNNGVLFVSLDDKENHYCKVLLDDIFGRENFIADICHKSRGSISNDKIISPNHNHVLFYAKNGQNCNENRSRFGIEKDLSTFIEKDETGYYKLVPVDGPGGEKKGNPFYEFLGISNYWRFSQERMQKMFEDGLIVKKGNSLYQKYYKSKASESRQTITTWWDDGLLTSSATTELKKVLDEETFSNPKNESLIELILEFATRSGDLILDFFLGSGTTAAVAHKMQRRYIGIEQLPYFDTITVRRLEKVIAGEQSGVSVAQHWHGGGSFVSCELAADNARFVEEIAVAGNDAALTALLWKIIGTGYASHRVWTKDLKSYEADFAALGTEEKRQVLFELLDANMLYVNKSDIDDAESGLTDADKAFTRSFYGE